MRAPAKGLGPREARAARARAKGTMTNFHVFNNCFFYINFLATTGLTAKTIFSGPLGN